MKHKIERTGCLQEVVTRSAVTDPMQPSVKEPLPGCPDLFVTGQVQVTLPTTSPSHYLQKRNQRCGSTACPANSALGAYLGCNLSDNQEPRSPE